MYGSSLMLVTRRPRASMSAPIEAAARPFPMELTTPPVTKMYFVGLEFMASSARLRTTVNAEKPHGFWGFSGTSAPFGENLGRGFGRIRRTLGAPLLGVNAPREPRPRSRASASIFGDF